MSWGFTCSVTGGGRGLLVRRGPGRVVEFAFGLPGEPVAGWEPDETEARLTSADSFFARLRHVIDDDGWTTAVTLDNTADVERALPPLGMAVTVAPGWAGWSWTSDTEGFVLVAPVGAAGPLLVARVRQGFLRAASERPAFVALDRRGESLGEGVAAFHLAHPTGSLRAFGRHQTTLEFSELPDAAAAAGLLPGWLPDLVVSPNDELRLNTPDLAVVPGPGVRMGSEDTTTVLVGEPGHREVAVHGVRGVQRLRVTYRPGLEPFLADLVTALKSKRPSAVPSATAAVIACALARRAVLDPENVLDWLEREDWLARRDLFGIAVAVVVAAETHDEALLGQAAEALVAVGDQTGRGIVATRCWLATLALGMPPIDLTPLLGTGFEGAVLGGGDETVWGGRVPGLANRFAAGLLPGQPVGLAETEAGLLVALLRLVPEHWGSRATASEAAERGVALLLADHADGLHPSYEGLAWLLLGDVAT